jgi:hypothetical protein
MATLEELWIAGKLVGKHSKQLIGLAGNGNIRDSDTSKEVRECLRAVNLEDLQRFARECLDDGKWENSGFFLQDLINELGCRLGFDVEFGRYQGSAAKPAPDGVWRSKDWTFVVEIKTTDAYRVSLDRLAVYRKTTSEQSGIDLPASSVLIVVGRQDTGELEAQVRGSKHAWDMRLIGIEGLFKIALLHRDSVEQEAVLDKIRAILRPQEYTRVDGLLDVVFETAIAVSVEEREGSVAAPRQENGQDASQRLDSPAVKEELRELVFRVMEAREQKKFKKVRRSLYESLDGTTRYSLAISKNYGSPEKASYWYAYHPTQKSFVEMAGHGFAIFGCEGLGVAVALPSRLIASHLPTLSQTQSVDRPAYWHVFIKTSQDRFLLETKKGHSDIDVTDHVLSLEDRGRIEALGPVLL